MAKTRRWSRYQPPAEKRDEQGQARVMPPEPKPKPKPAARSKPKPAPKSGWIGLGIMAVVLVIVVGIVAGVRGSNDDEHTDLETSLLNEDFIGSSLAQAEKAEGKNPVSVRLDEYGMKVEYYDPNARQTRLFETNDYVDGYTLRVEDSPYDDYQPRRFDLGAIDAATMIAAVKDALAQTDDAFTYSLRIEADRATGEVTMVVSVSGDDTIEITSAP